MFIKITELSSGFANVPNNCIFGDGHERSDRPGSAYDVVHICKLPENLTMKEYSMCGGAVNVEYPTDEKGRVFDIIYVKNHFVHIMAEDGTDYKLEEVVE